MKRTLFILLIIISLNLSAQKYPRIYLSTMPFSLVDFNQPHLRLSSRIFVTKLITLETTFGYGSDFVNFIRNDIVNFNSKQYRIEINRILRRQKSIYFYIGFEYFFLKNKSIFLNSYCRFEEGFMSFSRMDCVKNKEGFIIKGGFLYFIGKVFFIDTYFGFGYKRSFISLSNPINSSISVNEPADNKYFYLKPGFKHGLNITGGIKTGIRF